MLENKKFALQNALDLQRQNSTVLTVSQLIEDAENIYKWLCKNS